MTAQLNSCSLLHRAPEIDLSLEGNGEIIIRSADGERRFGPLALALLNAFSIPRPLGTGLACLAPFLTGDQALDDTLGTIQRLLEAGVLNIGERSPAFSTRPFPFGLYDSPGVHIRILDDTKRRKAWLAGVAAATCPGDVVIDLGTGSGILAVAAARAGAARVYAVEPSNTVAAARQVIADQDQTERVQVIQGWSQHLTLPERADLLTLDLVGSEPLEMRVIELVRDAHARLLRTGARVLPAAVSLKLRPVQVADQVRDPYVIGRSHLERWRDAYGMDFSGLSQAQRNGWVPIYLPPVEAGQAITLGPDATAWSVLLDKPDVPAPTSTEVRLRITKDSILDGVVGVVHIKLAPDVDYVADPLNPGPAPHWMAPIWLAPEKLQVRAGQEIVLRYNYLGDGRSSVSLGDPA